ncbi:DUF5107 domain-containing protein [Arthrobacter tecti]
MIIDSYLPDDPSAYPAFLENRVYQGSSGRVFPLPFHERISQVKVPHEWQAVHLENQWVRLVILPELGGRVHIGYDKVADYDFFYRNNVIKPALVGLAGPWISGGVEFNWPQHHRPATFLPTDFHIEEEPDGAVTVWCSDHDPMNRMKGMHGIRLTPDSSVIEARVRLYNRTQDTQTFLWWANVAAAVNDDYQSFFPTDVAHVADHAKRATATFPEVEGTYYGVDYAAEMSEETPDRHRLDWYRNIPVPTSYMVTATRDDFFGGYDHGRNAGFIHWADRHVAPGKKQWTWGNAEFGYAWDRNLTDDDGPYVELMAGAYTDNQPDFSYLQPGETKTFSQYWYPIQGIGPAHQANLEAAVRFDVIPQDSTTRLGIGITTTRHRPELRVTVTGPEAEALYTETIEARVGEPVILTPDLGARYDTDELTVTLTEAGSELLSWSSRPAAQPLPAPALATEPPAPGDIHSVDELFYTGQYLQQYRHATRSPEPYWLEALRRDPSHVGANTALGALRDRAGRFIDAERFYRTAVDRLIARVPTPATGESHYRLGLNLTHQKRDDEARDFLEKAAWDAAWVAPACFALAQIDARADKWKACEEHLRKTLAHDAGHSQALCLLALALDEAGRPEETAAQVDAVLSNDPLDQWARHIAGLKLTEDAPTLLDVAMEYAAVGLIDAALQVLDEAAAAAEHTATGQVNVAPLVQYHRAYLFARSARTRDAAAAAASALGTDATHCLPSRLADIQALEHAATEYQRDGLAPALLGHWYYDAGRHDDAILAWTQAITRQLDPGQLKVVYRNLGVAAFNVRHDPIAAVGFYARALELDSEDSKLVFEYDQLILRAGRTPADRLQFLEHRAHLISERDDLTVVYARLLTKAGRAAEARELLLNRSFQPWEGGEGQVLTAWEETLVALAGSAPSPEESVDFLQQALRIPRNLGEARHPLANTARLVWLLGEAHHRAGNDDDARRAWEQAASARGDFVDMADLPYSTHTYYSVLALRRLDREAAAAELTQELTRFTDQLAVTPAKVDFFATSLPSMLLFHDSPQEHQDRLVNTLRVQLRQLRT